MRSDADIRQDVEAELRWTPDVNETDIAVKVSSGVVSLLGYVASYREKFHAEAAVKRIAGVTAVANDLAVRLPLGERPIDPQIAQDVVAAIRIELPLLWQSIKVLVREGHVGLEGTVAWHYQRESAERAARAVSGVVSVRNSIRLQPRVAAVDIQARIEEAFRRNAAVDAAGITVVARGSEILLRGEVRSWSERDQAQQTAWSAPGVTNVRNELVVRT